MNLKRYKIQSSDRCDNILVRYMCKEACIKPVRRHDGWHGTLFILREKGPPCRLWAVFAKLLVHIPVGCWCMQTV